MISNVHHYWYSTQVPVKYKTSLCDSCRTEMARYSVTQTGHEPELPSPFSKTMIDFWKSKMRGAIKKSSIIRKQVVLHPYKIVLQWI